MALLLLGDNMKVGKFELDTPRQAEAAKEPRAETETRPAVRAAGAAADDEQRREEPTEEPGYGHGV